MDEYRTASCASCKQNIYLARRLLKDAFWVCPGCGAENMALGTVRPVTTALPPSRFARKHPTGNAPVVQYRRAKKVSLVKRLTGRSGAT